MALLYTAETTLALGQTRIKEIEKEKRKILRKLLGPVNKDGMWIKRSSKTCTKLTLKQNLPEKEVTFLGCTNTMDQDRIEKILILQTVKKQVKIDKRISSRS